MKGQSHIVVAFLFGAFGLTAWAQTEGTPVANEAPAAQEVISPELALIRDQLFNNKDSATRLSAASVLLFKEEPAARDLVLEALKQSENMAARAAVCKALDLSRTDPRQLRNKEDFLPPLIAVLGTDGDASVARLAAEATLMFSYEQLQADLEKIAGDNQRSGKVRSAVVYALQLHPDKRAALQLIGLLDCPDTSVAQAARNALTSLGIASGQDAEGRRQAISELQQQGSEAYLRKRLVRSEADIRELRSETALWQGRYFAVLSDWYDSLGDETGRSNFLAERLKAAEPVVRLWALDRLEELQKGTSKPKLSEELERTLLGLVSNENRQVRLKTARVLTRMWELNSAERLLQQLQVEQDAEISQELFIALGGACHYASLPVSAFKVPDEVRRQTLEWAVKFLGDTRAGGVRSGAEVIRKLLEQDGLQPQEVEKYLGALGQRYQKANGETEPDLRAELLKAMVGLCAPASTCRSQAIKLYAPVFEAGLGSPADVVRQAAADGFISIDKAAALKRLKNGLVEDPSQSIRAKLINLAGEVGTAEDLDWLSKKIGTPNEGELAWQAMLKIFRRSGTDVMSVWVAAFASSPMQEKLSREQKVSFLTLVEQRAQSENKADLLREVRTKLAQLYTDSGNFKQAAEYLRLLEEAAGSAREKASLLCERLDVSLRWPNVDLAAEVVGNFLLQNDLGADSAMAKLIDSYLGQPPSGADPNALLAKLGEIEIKEPDGRPLWRELLRRWGKPLAKADKPGEPEKAGN